MAKTFEDYRKEMTDYKEKLIADRSRGKTIPKTETAEAKIPKSVGAAAAGFEFPEDVFREYTKNAKDKKAARRMEKYGGEIAKILEELGKKGKKTNRDQFALDYLNSLPSAPEKLVKILEEKLKQKSEPAKENKDETPIRKVEMEPQAEKQEEKEEGKDALSQEQTDFLKEFGEKMEKEVLTELEKASEEKARENKSTKTNKQLEEDLKKIETKEGLLNYLRALDAVRIKPRASYYFPPSYLEKVEKVFRGESYWNEIGIPILRRKIIEIIKKDRSTKIGQFFGKKKDQTREEEKEPIKEIKKGIFAKQLHADVSETAPETYKKGVYANGSVPEDAKEEHQKIKNLKKLEKSEEKDEDVPLKKREETEKERVEKAQDETGENQPEETKNQPREGGIESETGDKPAKLKQLEEELADLERQLQYAKREGDEGIISELYQQITAKKSEIEDWNKTPEELFEEGQRLEAEEKYKREKAEAKEERKREEARERAERLAELQKELDEARMRYAREDYGTHNVISKIKSILGIQLNSRKIDRVNAYYNDYRIKLTELLDLRLEELKSKGLGGEELKREMGELIKYFNFDEKINLFDAHTEARGKVWEEKFGKAPGWMAEKSSKFINWYRKVDWKKKMAFNVALGLSGVGAVVLGTNRIVSGAITGVGVAGVLEARHRKKEAKLAEKNKEAMLKNFEDAEDKFTFIMNELQTKIDGCDKSLKIEKDKARARRLIGTVAGVFVGSGALSWLVGKSGAGSWVAEKLGLSAVPDDLSAKEASKELKREYWKNYFDKYGETGKSSLSEEAQKIVGAETGKHVENLLTVREGSSLEGTLIEHFKGTGMSAEEAGRKAHQVALEYANRLGLEKGPHSLIHPGARIQLEGDKIFSITGDDNLGWLPEKDKIISDVDLHDIEEKETILSPKEGIFEGARGETIFGKNIDHVIADLDDQIENNAGELSRSYTHSPEQLDSFKERIADLGYNKGFLEKFRDSILSGDSQGATRYFRSAISLDEDWNKIKEMTFKEAAQNMNWRSSGKLESIFRSLKEIIGDGVRPGKNETLEKWTERISGLAVEKAGEK